MPGLVLTTLHMAAKQLDKKLLEEIKGMLLEQKTNLERELAQFTQANSNNEDDFKATFPDFGDKEDENSAEVATYGDNLSLEHSLEKSLRDAKKALKRIEDGTYGYCKYCNELINPERLRARPSSSSCMDCKTRLKGR